MSKNKEKMEKYKGVRDFYPEDEFMQEHIKITMRNVVEHFGYEPYNASILEPLSLYEGKTSEEILNEQIYTFTDRGGRKVALRPEMTPTVARMVAAKKRELSFPLRLYSIPNVFRYEKPQRGRLREHWQLNCDLFGVSQTEGDVEILLIAYEIMHGFRATENDFIIKVNHRGVLPELLEHIAKENSLSFPKKKHFDLIRLMDKKDKVSAKEYREMLTHLLGEKLALVLIEKYTSENIISILPTLPAGKELFSILETVEKRGIKNVIFDPFLMRGFDYYTGMIFEVFDTDKKNNRSLFGGGRYDNLLSTLFGTDPVPTVGFGMGDVTIKDFLETHDLLPEYMPITMLVIAVENEKCYEKASEIAKKLRVRDIPVSIDYSIKKIQDQIKNAEKKKVPYFLRIEEKEMEEDIYILRDLFSGQKIFVAEKDIADALFEKEELYTEV